MAYATLAADAGFFDRTFVECIDDAIQSILGAQVAVSLFTHLEDCYGLTRDEIPCRLDVFFNGLEISFGQSSGRAIGKFIIKVFYRRLGLEFDSRSNWVPLDYMEAARRKLGLEN